MGGCVDTTEKTDNGRTPFFSPPVASTIFVAGEILSRMVAPLFAIASQTNTSTSHLSSSFPHSSFVYKKRVSGAKWACLPIVIGGVVLASVKELDFAWSALISACIANMFAAVKGNENKAIMDDPNMRERFGTIGNQFAITSILAFMMSIPLMLATEGHKLGQFAGLWRTNPIVSYNLIGKT